MEIDPTFAKRKNAAKARRIVLQVICLIILVAVFVNFVVLPQVLSGETDGAFAGNTVPLKNRRYVPYDELKQEVPLQREEGFIALSYFGVDEEGTETVISRKRLNDHLKALKAAGYVTISQQDLYEYYYNGGSLPEKALFLFFEDGRRKSAVIAEELMRAYNFRASMLSYANNLNDQDAFFLTTSELLEMEKSGYWEMGTNGYRLSYINVFDRHENYLGELTPREYFFIAPYVRRDYNHYLMDYIRDKYDIPLESRGQMQARVAQEYSLMDAIYDDKLGKLPMLYALMHANTGQFATNNAVSVENEKWIGEYFKFNFNREMYCHNDLSVNAYDLTRMQPQAYWPTNHLLMRILYDTDAQGIEFVTGDAERYGQWNLTQGAVEFDGDTIFVTSLPESVGSVSLPASKGLRNFYLSTRFIGNKLGTQSVDLMSDASGAYIAVEIRNNVLLIYPGQGGAQSGEAMFELDLDVHNGVVYQTWEENRQEAMAVEIEQKLQQTYQAEESQRIAQELTLKKADTSKANNEPYIPDITLKDAGDHFVEIAYTGRAITVTVDGKVAVSDLLVDGGLSGGIALRSAWSEYGFSQRNLADDVYDGAFQSLYLTSLQGQADGQPAVILDYRAPAVPDPAEIVEEEPEDPTPLGHVKAAAKSVWRFMRRWVPGFSNWN
ncbi:MAG TPA: glycoside hydrolase [Clostridia bacterium]|nr:glycoside hydrolase [Clostridia bacterium]